MTGGIIEKLKEIIVDELDVDQTMESIDENESLFEDGIGLDSVVIMEFIVMIEEVFQFKFSEDELNIESFGSLAALGNVIAKKKGESIA